MDFLGHSSGVLIGRQFFLHEYKNACSGTQQWSHLQTICFAWIENVFTDRRMHFLGHSGGE